MRLLYFSPVAAASYAQRPHYMVQAWLRRGVEQVLWVEPYAKRLPRLADLRVSRSSAGQAAVLDPRVKTLRVRALPVEPLPGGAALNDRLLWRDVWRALEDFTSPGITIVGVGCPSALALAALRRLPCRFSFYDAMDDFPEFFSGLSRVALQRREDAIARAASWIVTSSAWLHEKFSKRRPSVELVLNAYAMDTVQGPGARDQQPPVLGYIGCLGGWFDWPLVLSIAQTFPELVVRLIGPVAAPPPRHLPGNIQLLPACPQREASRHVRDFSVGLVPFRVDRLTRGVDPIKFYEYRAHGLPVVATAFGQLRERCGEPGVFLIDGQRNAATCVVAALRHAESPAAVEAFQADNDWRARFESARVFELAEGRSHSRVPAPKGLAFGKSGLGTKRGRTNA